MQWLIEEDKKCSTKYYEENERLCNISPTNSGCALRHDRRMDVHSGVTER
jgi:hypothetical protein